MSPQVRYLFASLVNRIIQFAQQVERPLESHRFESGFAAFLGGIASRHAGLAVD